LTAAACLASLGHDVDFIVSTNSKSSYPTSLGGGLETGQFDLDLRDVNFVRIRPPSSVTDSIFNRTIYGPLLNDAYRKGQVKKLPKYDLMLNGDMCSTISQKDLTSIKMVFFPSVPNATTVRTWDLYRQLYVKLYLRRLRKFTRLWANSEFVAKCIQSTGPTPPVSVLYPPIEVERFRALKKENIILTVGTYGEFKNQAMLINTFRELHDELPRWKLVLAGRIPLSAKGSLIALKKMAIGLPVEFHHDVHFDKIKVLYGKAKIYWHAKGYGTNDPNLFEHFGMSTVEAQASRCVPVVIDKGGQQEIVEHGVTGFKWKTKEELKEFTLKMANEPGLTQRIAKRAQDTSKRFGVKAYTKELERELSSLFDR